jgi:SOS-response transcriptional repressor LexA
METLNKRIERLMLATQWKQADVARHAGVSETTVHKWLGKGKPGAAVTLAIRDRAAAARLARASGFRAEWLAHGEGAERDTANTAPGPQIRGRVPLISRVQAGTWDTAHDPLAPGDAEAWLDCPASCSPSTYALRVQGESMTSPYPGARSYPEGCVIFVDPEKKAPTSGARIIAKLSGTDAVTFKVFRQEDGRTWLQPINPTHPPITDPFQVLGTVIGKWEAE